MGILKKITYVIKKNIYWKAQSILRGFSDCDLWSLDFHLAKLILKRLIAFKKMNKHGTPCCINPNYNMTDEERINKWNNIIDSMIWSFEYITKYDYGNDYPGVYTNNPVPKNIEFMIDSPDKKDYSIINPEYEKIQDLKFNKELHNELYEKYKLGMNNFAEYFCNLCD